MNLNLAGSDFGDSNLGFNPGPGFVFRIRPYNNQKFLKKKNRYYVQVLTIDTERRLEIFCVDENVTFPVGNL